VQCPSYVFAETLTDDTAVTVRAAGANDGPKIRRAFLNLERDTVYTRFFGYKADVSDAELGRITGADFERAVALLVNHRSRPIWMVSGPSRGPVPGMADDTQLATASIIRANEPRPRARAAMTASRPRLRPNRCTAKSSIKSTRKK